MKLIDNGIIRKLQADKDCKITDGKYSFFSDFIILGKNDISDKYIEVPYEVWGSFLSNSAPKTKVEELEQQLSCLQEEKDYLEMILLNTDFRLTCMELKDQGLLD